MYVEANDARFWVVEKGEGSVVLFLHSDARRDREARPARAVRRGPRGGTTHSWRRFVEVDSDHYRTLREAELVTGLIRDVLLSNEEVPSG